MKPGISAILMIFSFTICAQSLDDVYTSWAKREVPNSYKQIRTMVSDVWGDDEKRTAPLVELQCKALNGLLMSAQRGQINADILLVALDKWSKAADSEKGDMWWEWPNTNWMKVASEYKSLEKSGKKS
jgi:hypothetical protein